MASGPSGAQSRSSILERQQRKERAMGKDIDLQGKVALVTGGGQGIGRGIAKVLGECGATVIVSDINPDTTAATAAELGAKALPLNVADQAAFNSAVDQVVADQGSLDIHDNNAGV